MLSKSPVEILPPIDSFSHFLTGLMLFVPEYYLLLPSKMILLSSGADEMASRESDHGNNINFYLAPSFNFELDLLRFLWF